MLALLIGLALSGCGTPTPTAPTTVTGAGFTFDLPPDWKADTAVSSGQGGDNIAVAHPDGRSTNLRVGRATAADQVLGSLDEYRLSFVPAILHQIPGTTLTDGPTTITVGGEPAVEFRYSGTSQGVAFVGDQVQTVHSGRLYIVTLSASADDSQALAALQMALRTWAWR